MATPERSRDASAAETATRDAMTTTTRAPFDPSELSREARDKMALLERRMTSVERSSGNRARGRGATRFAVEDGDRSDSRGPGVEDSEASSSSSSPPSPRPQDLASRFDHRPPPRIASPRALARGSRSTARRSSSVAPRAPSYPSPLGSARTGRTGRESSSSSHRASPSPRQTRRAIVRASPSDD